MTCAAALALAWASPCDGAEFKLADGLVGQLENARFRLVVVTRPGDGWWRLAERASGDGSRHAELSSVHRGARLVPGARFDVPTELWRPGLGARLVQAAFPDDGPTEAGWRHRVTDGKTLGRAESPWTLAQLFTGDGRNHGHLQLSSASRRRGLRPGDDVVIPWKHLALHLRPVADGTELPATPPPAPQARAKPKPFRLVPGTKSADGLLTYQVDDAGPHAVYELRSGETLYTHVVMRFTDLLLGGEVNGAAQRYAKRSGIADVRDMPIGQAVRIPLDDLSPEHAPPGHPARVEWEKERAESERLARLEKRQNLEGIHVLIDAGHGGADPGAQSHRVWEDDYAYDIACRIMAFLNDRTHAHVYPLVKDRSTAHAPLSRMSRDRDEVLLTTPALDLAKVDTKVAVNMRWVLANDIRRKLLKKGVRTDRIVFLSIHADSLHESARGAMAYYPEAKYRKPRFSVPRGGAYAHLAEAQAANGFTMSRPDMLRAEGLSRNLGEAIVAAVAARNLPVHRFKPVRGHVVRGKAWIPAVIKYNRIPASVLVEACNINNAQDQLALRDPTFRQELAEAVVEGLVAHFQGDETPVKRAAR